SLDDAQDADHGARGDPDGTPTAADRPAVQGTSGDNARGSAKSAVIGERERPRAEAPGTAEQRRLDVPLMLSTPTTATRAATRRPFLCRSSPYPTPLPESLCLKVA